MVYLVDNFIKLSLCLEVQSNTRNVNKSFWTNYCLCMQSEVCPLHIRAQMIRINGPGGCRSVNNKATGFISDYTTVTEPWYTYIRRIRIHIQLCK